MAPADTADCIGHHVTIAGRTDTLFSQDAITLIHNAARGYPRAVNNLAVHALTRRLRRRNRDRRRASRPHRRHRSRQRLSH